MKKKERARGGEKIANKYKGSISYRIFFYLIDGPYTQVGDNKND